MARRIFKRDARGRFARTNGGKGKASSYKAEWDDPNNVWGL